MNRMGVPTNFVGNDFILPPAKPEKVQPLVQSAPMPMHIPVLAAPSAGAIDIAIHRQAAESVTSKNDSIVNKAVGLFHRYTLGVFAILILVVGSSGIQVASQYAAASTNEALFKSANFKLTAPTIAGLNKKVPTATVDQEIQKIVSQSATLTVGNQSQAIKPQTIKSWLNISAIPGTDQSAIKIRANAIAESLIAIANKSVVTPVDQVTIVREDGVPTIISAGKNGSRLTNPNTIKEQANQVAKTLMDSKGISFNTPMETVPFQALTPEAFDKLITVNISTKQLYAYEKGQLVKTFPISAGAPKTPTPIGQFKIYSKTPVQDMKGFNADGSKYFQPNVRWISYFLPGGYAIHGNYWRPASWFGNINSSHGCVSLPDSQAKWVYDFAPVGTTIITHN